MEIKSLIKKTLEQVFEKAISSSDDTHKTRLNLSPSISRSRCGAHFQSACALGHPDSMSFASKMVSSIVAQNYPYIKRVYVSIPGFINIVLNEECLIDHACNFMQHLDLIRDSKKLFIDFGGVNVAKPLHIGHIRSLFIGDFLQRMYRYLGHQVVSDIHLGDWGVQIGMIIAFHKERHLSPSTVNPFTIDYLSTIYPIASQECKSDVAKMNVAKSITTLVQKRDPEMLILWHQIMDTSLTYIKQEISKLKISFDLWLGESDAATAVKIVLQAGIEQGLIYEDQESMVMDIGQIVPLVKKDGSYLYSMTDIGTVKDRVDIGADVLIYVIDRRQNLHIQQVFKMCDKLGICDYSKFVYVGFGTVNDTDGLPFKTRSGASISLSQVQKESRKHVYVSDSVEKNTDVQDEIKDMISLAAMKYSTLSFSNNTNYVFNMQSFLQSEGKTGPYILYTAVRIKSLLRKNNLQEDLLVEPFEISDQEARLSLELMSFADILEQCQKKHDPHFLCEHMYSLSSAFNRFYNECEILQNKDMNILRTRIKLCKATLKQLEISCDLLGIIIPENM